MGYTFRRKRPSRNSMPRRQDETQSTSIDDLTQYSPPDYSKYNFYLLLLIVLLLLVIVVGGWFKGIPVKMR